MVRYIMLCFTALALGTGAAAADLSKIDSRTTFVKAIAGKSLNIGLYGITLNVSNSGKITGRAVGRPVSGDWSWQNGFFCRSLTWGERELPYNCQRVDYGGDTIRFTSDKGAGRSADFRLR